MWHTLVAIEQLACTKIDLDLFKVSDAVSVEGQTRLKLQ